MPEFDPYDLQDRELNSYRRVDTPSPFDTAQAVVNPDGSLIASAPPAGGATAANQALEIAALNEIATDTDHLDTNLSTLATQATLAEIATDTDNLATITTNTTGLATQATLASVLSNQTNGTQKAINIAALVPVAYDTIQVTAVDGSDRPTTILYKTGGLAGATVATLTIVYDGSGNFQSVVRT